MEHHLPPPRRDREPHELLELDALDDEVAAFPTEDRELLERVNASRRRDRVQIEDEFPSELSAVAEPTIAPAPRESCQDEDQFLSEPPLAEQASEEPAQAFESTKLASVSVPVAPAHRPGPRLLAVAALLIAVTGVLGLDVFIRSHREDAHPSVTQASDVPLVAAATIPPSSAPIEDLAPVPETASSSIVRSTETPEELTPAPSRPQRVEPSDRTGASGGPETPTLTARDVVAANTTSLAVDAPSATAVDVPASLPVGTASAPAEATERPVLDRPADANIVAPGGPRAIPVVAPAGAIQRALAQYQTAFSQRDVAAVRQVWPTVNGKALARAFDQLREENLTFESCAVTVAGQTAVASCQGTNQYVPKVGSKSARVERRQWRLSLRLVTDGWVIDAVEVSED